MSILVLTTGGTIGALAYDDPSHPPKLSIMPEGRDIVCEVLAQSEFQTYATRCLSLEPRDSKLIDVTYLEKMFDTAMTAPEGNILITHGTDRILNTADYFYQRFKSHPSLALHKRIILTGAMVPLANSAISEGFQNLNFSLQLFITPEKLTEAGVYIVLCDYQGRNWQPILYPYKPGIYEKFYANDARYHRLQHIT